MKVIHWKEREEEAEEMDVKVGELFVVVLDCEKDESGDEDYFVRVDLSVVHCEVQCCRGSEK
jgi:dTDP-4-dehydrorhamnose 3,5-epimerase-like enzyme